MAEPHQDRAAATVPLAPLFVLWEGLTADLLERTAKFPKASRFTFTQRVENLAIDLLELFAAAQWTSGALKREHLRVSDEKLLRLRVLLRLCHTRRLLDHGGYEHVARSLDEAGRMLGGWRRHAAAAGPS
jgi:hypothetical protein